MEGSKIEWTKHTTNLWWGCTEVHEGCDNCYARVFANRFGTKWGNGELRQHKPKAFAQTLTMQAKAAAAGRIDRVFVGSMMDIFEKSMKMLYPDGSIGYTDTVRGKFFEEVVPACPNLQLLLLTKRPSNIRKFVPVAWLEHWPPNVMVGTSISTAEQMPKILKQFAAQPGRKFLSVEPQLDFIDFSGRLAGIDWLIQGGESGMKRRPFDVSWARHTRDVCQAEGVPYFFKQIDKVRPIPDDLMVKEFPK